MYVYRLRALPQHNRQIATEKQVQNVLRLVGHFEAESFADHYVPEGSELLVHAVFDGFGGHFVVLGVLFTGGDAYLDRFGSHLVGHVGMLSVEKGEELSSQGRMKLQLP
jgi:hypothetical protein